MLLRIIEFFGHEEHTKFLLNYGSVKDNRYHGIKKKSFAEMVNPKLHELAVPEALGHPTHQVLQQARIPPR